VLDCKEEWGLAVNIALVEDPGPEILLREDGLDLREVASDDRQMEVRVALMVFEGGVI
jgi:hypothetical protein